MGGQFSRAEPVTDEEAQSVLQYDCSVKAIADYISSGKAKNIIVMVGAGVSVSAGIPDFRTPGTGLYDNLQKYNLPTPQAIFEIGYFKDRPDAFYQLAKEMWPGQFTPTPAHYFIRLLHEKGLLKRCFTQNIDSLEGQAGVPLDKIVAAHGNFDSATCITTGEKVPIEEVREAVEKEKWAELRDKYGGLVKPDIVFFGESLPLRFADLRKADFPTADLLIVMGTSLKVQPFASLINDVGKLVPRLLINRELVGERLEFESAGFRFNGEDNYRDVAMLTDCDNGVQALAALLGWQEDLANLVQKETGKPLSGPHDITSIAEVQWRAPPLVIATAADCPHFCQVRVLKAARQLEVQWHCTTSAEGVNYIMCLIGTALETAMQWYKAPADPPEMPHCSTILVEPTSAKEGKAVLSLPANDDQEVDAADFEVWLVGDHGAILTKLCIPGLKAAEPSVSEALNNLHINQ